ncbi:MAG: RdgB/HAM1 family non-canonical purine NTP pyrophosphatase [Candidatus Kerfeldbacteria bacterium]
MMKKIIFATHNPGKIREMRDFLGEGFAVITASEAGILEDVVEDGKTFEENALKKARFVNSKTKEWSMADDSGLCVDALDGRPGIYSARWAGENATDDEILSKLIDELKDVPQEKRTAVFNSAVALVSPDGKEYTFSGHINGSIPELQVGVNNKKLPYDSIFIPEGQDKTFAEMTKEEKNSISHRGIAFNKLKDFLKNTN